MLGCEDECEASLGLGGDPRSGFPGNMGRMIVEDQLDGSLRRISGVELLEEADELARADDAPIAAGAAGDLCIRNATRKFNPGRVTACPVLTLV